MIKVRVMIKIRIKVRMRIVRSYLCVCVCIDKVHVPVVKFVHIKSLMTVSLVECMCIWLVLSCGFGIR